MWEAVGARPERPLRNVSVSLVLVPFPRSFACCPSRYNNYDPKCCALANAQVRQYTFCKNRTNALFSMEVEIVYCFVSMRHVVGLVFLDKNMNSSRKSFFIP